MDYGKGFEFSSNTTKKSAFFGFKRNVTTTIEWIHGSQRMNASNFAAQMHHRTSSMAIDPQLLTAERRCMKTNKINDLPLRLATPCRGAHSGSSVSISLANHPTLHGDLMIQI